MEDLTGRQFGPYRVVAPLGEGGMAAVYKAYQPAVNRYIALKVLPRHFTADPQFLGRFRHEAQIVAQFQHPHIVPVFDFGEVDGYTFLAMPFITGGTLAGLMNGKPIALDIARRVVQQVGDALDYAHSKGIVHRDIKPSNVLMDELGNCLVADFGIARMAEGATKLTMTGALIGTPAYMSPEQAMAETVGPESDLYSVGIVLYEMLTGRVPFQAETPIAVAIKHVNAPLPPPRTFNPALSPEIEAVILKALARSRDDRFESGKALSTALSAAVQSTQRTETSILDPPIRDSFDGTHTAREKQEFDGEDEAKRSVPAESRFPNVADQKPGSETAAWLTLALIIGSFLILALILILGLLAHFSPLDRARIQGGTVPSDTGQPASVFPAPTPVGAAPGPSVAAAPALSVNDALANLSIHWARIPAGTLQMGCVAGDTECGDNEKPRHQVTLSKAFDLMTTETTLGMFRAFASATGQAVPDQPDWNTDARQPIVNVTWYEAAAFCGLDRRRLPTEAEWGYAARGGQEGMKYVWGNGPRPEVNGRPAANVADESAKRKNPTWVILPGYDDGYAETARVGSFAPNAFGLYDMAGNVWEWVADGYGPYSVGAATDPHGPSTGELRVVRGGGWFYYPRLLRVSGREQRAPVGRFVFVGVRCARDVSP